VAVWATAAETTVLAVANAKSNREIDMFHLLRFSSQADFRRKPEQESRRAAKATSIIKFELHDDPEPCIGQGRTAGPNPFACVGRSCNFTYSLVRPHELQNRTCRSLPTFTLVHIGGRARLVMGSVRMKLVLLGLSPLLLANAAAAQEVTLKAATAFTENTTYSRPFERFISRVNEDGKGILRINYVGGPKALPPFEIGNALKGGVVDMANAAGAFYTNLMPEADAWKLTERPMSELRRNGGYAAMAAIYAQKLNAIFLARLVDNNPFHLYVNKPISAPDLTGLKLRITPVYRDFFQALGATVVQTAPGEVYTALERGVVDGYGWPISGIFDLSWHEKTKYRVDPGFYTAEVSVLINKNSWDRLNEAQKNVLRKSAERGEGDAVAEFGEENEREISRQAAAGIKTIKFEGATASAYLAKAYQAGWDGIIRQSAATGPKLKELFQKAP